MQINLDTLIKQIDKDEAIQSGDQCKLCGSITDGEDLTFRKAVVRALLNSSVSKSDEKIERFTLAQMIQAAPPTLTLDNDQIQWIKDDVSNAYGIIILGRVYEMLDPIKMDKLKKLAKPVTTSVKPNA